MARIVLITHEYDRFSNRRGLFHRHNRCMFATAVPELRARGHTCIVLQGLGDRPQGDAALLHVDATVTPQDYVDYASSFPICVTEPPTYPSERSARRLSNPAAAGKAR
ncbi:hypothetical protein [Mesorhizobium sp. 10J20-29]